MQSFGAKIVPKILDARWGKAFKGETTQNREDFKREEDKKRRKG